MIPKSRPLKDPFREGGVAQQFRALDLKAGGSVFKPRPLATLVYSQLVCLLPVGIFNLLCSQYLIICLPLFPSEMPVN